MIAQETVVLDGEAYRVTEITGRDGERLWPLLTSPESGGGYSYSTIMEVAAACLVNENMLPRYADAPSMASHLSLRAILLVARTALRLSGLTQDGVELLEKN